MGKPSVEINVDKSLIIIVPPLSFSYYNIVSTSYQH
nr:MAG TPA: hypothetical protein [Caudoviricetes sp.]